MKFITLKDRNQTELFCREQAIAQDNEVRLIDLFVYAIKIEETIKHTAADIGFILTAFILRRIFNLIDQNTIKRYLAVLAYFCFGFAACFKRFFGMIFCQQNHDDHKKQAFLIAVNRLYLNPVKAFEN